MESKIVFHGSGSDEAEISISINDIEVYSGKINKQNLAIIENPPSTEHNDKIKIICHKGYVNIGTVDTSYCQDINPELTLLEKKQVWFDRQRNIKTKIKNPYIHYKNEYNEIYSNTRRIISDERFDIIYNGKKIDITAIPDDPKYKSYQGWVYRLDEGEEISFRIFVFRPFDLLNFVNEQKVGKEYFESKDHPFEF